MNGLKSQTQQYNNWIIKKTHYVVTRLFYTHFVQHNSAIEYDIHDYDIHDCLLSAGYHGPLPFTNLDEVFMKLYSYTGQTYL